jgi:hypothetical protein
MTPIRSRDYIWESRDDLQRRDWLAGAGGLEPPNGGIKIRLFRKFGQCLF